MKNQSILSEIGECGLISKIRESMNGAAHAGVPVGIGDDCAVVSPPCGEDLVLKIDPVILGRHFTQNDPPADVGHKALARTLSDIAAMGARPLCHLVGLTAPEDTTIEYVDEIYRGMSELAAKYGSVLAGGDTSRGETLTLQVCGCGTVPKGTAKLRSGAMPGDTIYVTGRLGGSFVSGRHLTFEPRVKEGLWLRSRANAMIDISDGLAADIWHIAEESKVNAFVATSLIPFSDAAAASGDPVAAAFFDGEDFELLFTIPASDRNFGDEWRAAFPDLPCTPIGVVGEKTQTPKVKYENPKDPEALPMELPRRGFDHFRIGDKRS